MTASQVIALLSGIAGVITAVTALIHSLGTRRIVNNPGPSPAGTPQGGQPAQPPR